MNIVLAAFGKRGYFYSAYNLAFSIKHYDKDAKILLIHDKGISALPPHEADIFDIKVEIDEATTHPLGLFDAGHVKLNVYKIATKHFKEYMFLDVDAIVLKSIKTWYSDAQNSGKEFLTDVRGIGGINDVINYSVWASNENIWEQFKLDKDTKYPAVQSSWHYAKKTKGNTAMFNDALKLNRTTFTDRSKLLIKWGKCLPDELVIGGALARRDFDASFDYEPIFFPNRHLPLSELKERYYVLSMFGNGRGAATMVKVDFKEFYDRYMIRMFKDNGMNLKYKNSSIMRDKMIN